MSWGLWGLLIALLSSPSTSRRKGRLGKPPNPGSLYPGGKPLTEAPGGLLTPHWLELRPVITIATKDAGKMGTWHSSSEEGTAVAVR